MAAASSPSLEAWRLGGTTCLFRPANQATCLVNGTAAGLVTAMARGLADREIAGQLMAESGLPLATALNHVVSLRKESRASGLIGPLAAPHEETHGPSSTASERACDNTLYALGPGQSVATTIADAPLRALIDALLAPLRIAPRPGKDAQHAVHAVTTAEAFSVSLDGHRIVRGADLATARRAILQGVLLSLHPRDDAAAILHGSAVSIGGRGVVLAGATGSGKSTLMLALIAAGARYLADDFTPLSCDGTRLAAFPVRASVKAGSWPIAAPWFPVLAAANTFTLGSRKVRYLDLRDRQAECTRGIPAAAIIFPRYAADKPTSLERLSPEAAFRWLMEAGSAPAGSPPSMRSIVELVTRVPAWSLGYSNVGEAVAVSSELCNAKPAPVQTFEVDPALISVPDLVPGTRPSTISGGQAR